MANGGQRRTRSERVAALELPPGRLERAWLALCHRDVLSRMGLALLGAAAGLLVAMTVMLVSYRNYALVYLPVPAVLRCVLTALVLGSLIAVVASIAPAYWAARKQPVDAMRVEE